MYVKMRVKYTSGACVFYVSKWVWKEKACS